MKKSCVCLFIIFFSLSAVAISTILCNKRNKVIFKNHISCYYVNKTVGNFNWDLRTN